VHRRIRFVVIPRRIQSWLPAFALLLAIASAANAQEVLRLAWPTRHAAPPASGTPEVAPYLPLLRASLNRLPESALVNLALMQSSSLGLSSSDADKLSGLVARRYELIAASPVFKNVPSTLGYCLAETRPPQGLALIYRPRQTNAQTPVLLFVHGYGGSFLWYLHQLAEWFPNHIIICPAYGIDPSAIPAVYLDECLREAAVRLKHPLARPALVGLSAGGFGTTRVYAANPASYQQLIVMAAYPPDESFRAWPKTARSGWIVGALEYYVKDGGFAAYSKSLAARSTRHQSVIIPKADHFFLLTHPAETRKTLLAWLSPPSAAP
jgi:pimeloyl-ACP methyl ester carboxylesterase